MQDYVALCAEMKQSALQNYQDKDALKMGLSTQKEHPALSLCKKHRLFKGHAKIQLALVLSKTQAVALQPGDVLFNAGDEVTALFILLSGELA